MSETGSTATPPATNGGLTKDDLQAAIAGVMQPLAKALGDLASNQKVIADTMAQQTAAPGSEKPVVKTDDKPKSLTADEIASVVATTIKKERDVQQQTDKLRADRETFVKSDKSGLAKLPAEFTSKLGDDPSKWESEAAGIKSSFEGFLKSAGVKLENIGGATREGGASPSAPPDPKTLTPDQFAKHYLPKPAGSPEAQSTTA